MRSFEAAPAHEFVSYSDFADSEPWKWHETRDEENDVTEFVHITVMRDEVVRALAPREGGLYVDATLGGGGHSEAILLANSGARVIAFDRDPAAIAAASARLEPFGERFSVIHANFSEIDERLRSIGITHVDGLCADLGVSSPQLDDAARGMSFRRAGPIDMRMNPDDGDTALELIARSSDEELADIIFRYGEERASRRIARSIKRAFDDEELLTTLDLRRAIVRAVGPSRSGGVDPATRTFQALRIAVNREVEELESLLDKLPELIAVGGVAAVISFHSIEDRLAKRAFAVKSRWQRLAKKPALAGVAESEENPRARSAKLRAAVRSDEESTERYT